MSHRAEYLHLVLTANRGVQLPAPTLWLLRHSKFRTLAAGDYGQLLDGVDRSMVPWLAEFQVRLSMLSAVCTPVAHLRWQLRSCTRITPCIQHTANCAHAAGSGSKESASAR